MVTGTAAVLAGVPEGSSAAICGARTAAAGADAPGPTTGPLSPAAPSESAIAAGAMPELAAGVGTPAGWTDAGPPRTDGVADA